VFYDKYGHTIQVKTTNQLYYTAVGTVTDTKTVVPDFTGKPLYTQVIQQISSSVSNKILTGLIYDSATNSRLSKITQTYNSQALDTVASYTYNELGQLVLKQLSWNGTKYLQNIDYRYNIRGQLLTINNSKLKGDGGVTNNDSNDLFGMQILYDQTDSNLGRLEQPSYTGMINAVKWMSRDSSDVKTNERSYVYAYDNLARYTASYYAERDTGSTSLFSVNNNGFNEYNITYDANGNIMTLNRNSSSIGATSYSKVDSLAYTYNGYNPNQLLTVTDATGNATLGFRNVTGSTTAYTYDANGNLTNDYYKGLQLYYNLMNRADTIKSTVVSGYITYTYDAAGAVLRRQVWSSGALTSTNDYIDGFMYTTTSGGTTLTYAPMPEGRLVTTGTTLTPEYVITDQQGNARFSFQQGTGGTIKIIQENSYYAFGEVLANSAVKTTPTNFKLYNGGSEWQNIFSGFPDYLQTFFRNYDPAIARFTGVDPEPENAADMTTYQYGGNNPVMGNDPMGNLLNSAKRNRVAAIGSSGGEDFNSPDSYQDYYSMLYTYGGQISGASNGPDEDATSDFGSGGSGGGLGNGDDGNASDESGNDYGRLNLNEELGGNAESQMLNYEESNFMVYIMRNVGDYTDNNNGTINWTTPYTYVDPESSTGFGGGIMQHSIQVSGLDANQGGINSDPYHGQDSQSNYNNGIAHASYPAVIASYNVLMQFSKGKNGKVSVSPTNVSASINGFHLGVSYQQLNNPIISVSGSIINFTVFGAQQYNIPIIGINLGEQDITISGSYNITNGQYNINVENTK
jgi:RHS repeat-associated protein